MAGLGRRTFTAGEVLTASNVQNYLQDQAVMVFAGTAARSSAIATPSEGMYTYQTDDNTLDVYNGSAWVTTTPSAGSVGTSQTTTSTSYTDLATVGPAVTLRTGTKAIITIGAYVTPAAGTNAAVSVAVSGATTISAADTKALQTAAAATGRYGTTVYFDNLTAGVNTFTLKYRGIGAGTQTFADRYITVIPIP